MSEGARSARITIVGPVHPLRGGIAHHTAMLAQALAERGCAVQLLSFRRLYPRALFPGRDQRDSSRRPLVFPSEAVLTPFQPLRWLAAMRAIGRFSPDLVIWAWWHSMFLPVTAFGLWWLRRIDRRRVALLCHNLRSHDHAALDRLAWPRLSRGPDIHIVTGSESARELRSMNPDARVVSLPHPPFDVFFDPQIDRAEARRRLGLDPDERVCLFFGTVRPYKGLDVAIEALARMREPERPLLLVAGEFYPPRDAVDRALGRLGRQGRVMIHDRYIRNEEVAVYFQAADVLVAPYRSATQSGVLQIARAFDLPVIASRVGSLADVVRDDETGLLVPAADPERLAEALRRFFTGNRGPRFRANLRSEKDGPSWGKLAAAVHELACDPATAKPGRA